MRQYKIDSLIRRQESVKKYCNFLYDEPPDGYDKIYFERHGGLQLFQIKILLNDPKGVNKKSFELIQLALVSHGVGAHHPYINKRFRLLDNFKDYCLEAKPFYRFNFTRYQPGNAIKIPPEKKEFTMASLNGKSRTFSRLDQ